MNGFQCVTYGQEFIFAPGSLTQLGETCEHFGFKRLMLCTNRSMRAGGHVATIEAALGKRLVTIFEHVLPHVQDVQVDEALALAREQNLDAVVGLGGGSPIGMAKAISFALNEKQNSARFVAIIAIPSTYAGSEMTPVYGITHSRETPPRKVTVSDRRIAPQLVIYDPKLTLDLPVEMTASTGINALAHCIEALYSIKRNPLSTAVAIDGIRHIHGALLGCYQDGKDLQARSELLIGSHLAGLSLASVVMGLHHGLCHVLGGTANIPHGIANAILLPHAIRFNADATVEQLLPAAEAMGIALNGSRSKIEVEALAQKITALVAMMNLPQRLREVNVRESDLSKLAQLGFQNRTVQNNPKPIHDAAQIEQLLQEAW